MPLIVYQVGDVPIFHPIVGVNNDGLEVSYTRTWRNPTTQLGAVSGKHTYLDATRPLSENPALTVKGTVLSTPQLSVDAMINRLMSAGGRIQTPIVAFRYQEICPVDDLCCSNADNPLDWLISYGIIISNPKIATLKNADSMYQFQMQGVELNIEIQTRWKRLTPFWWEYRKWETRFANPFAVANSQQGVDNYFNHPKTFQDFIPNSFFYKWNTSLSNYNPTFWGLKYSNGLSGGMGSDFITMNQVIVNSPQESWPATPSSVYAFTNLLPSGTLYLEVTKQNGFFAEQSQTEQATLDLVQLNTDIYNAGFGALYKNDIVITGVASPFPGFVIRNGSIIPTVRPKWSYPGKYVGELGIGYNTVRAYADTSSGSWAYLHDFGMY